MPQSPDWDEAYLAAIAEDEDPGDPEEDEDPGNAPPAGLDDQELAALIAEAREMTADQARAAEAAARLGQTAVLAGLGAMLTGRRGPGMPGSAQVVPGRGCEPGGRVRVRAAAGCRGGLRGAGVVPGGRGRRR